MKVGGVMVVRLGDSAMGGTPRCEGIYPEGQNRRSFGLCAACFCLECWVDFLRR